MKKLILALVVVISIIGTSCQKEEAAQPEVNSAVKVEKKETTQWD